MVQPDSDQWDQSKGFLHSQQNSCLQEPHVMWLHPDDLEMGASHLGQFLVLKDFHMRTRKPSPKREVLSASAQVLPG